MSPSKFALNVAIGRIYLLDKIRFSVAQDQDYLNRLCKGRVKIVDSNLEKSFEELGQENIDIAFKSPESYDTLEEMQKARQ